MPEPLPDPARPPRRDRRATALLAVLVALLAGSLLFTVRAEKPWGRAVQKRIEKKQPLTPKEYAIIGSWWGAATNAVLLALLLATARRWIPQGSQSASIATGLEPPAAGPARSRSFPCIAVALLATLAVTAWLRGPRLSHSLWNDEEYAMRRFAHGAWEQQKDGAWQFEPVGWTYTLFENRNGNNHLLNSLVTRLALDGWRLATGSAREAFSETALRLPAFLAGIATVAMVFLLGRRVAGPVAGLAAALLLALCPWHVRYSVEAKGYSLMLLFICVSIFGLIRALEDNRLRWWLMFALGEAAFLLSFAGSVYVAAALNLLAAVELLTRRQPRRLWTLAAFDLVAALPVIQWTLPSVPQLLAYLRSEESLHLELGWPWLRDFFSGLAIGFQFENPFPSEHLGTSWLMETAAHPWLAPFFFAAAALLVAGGLLSLWRAPAARLAVTAPMLAVLGAYTHNFIAGSPMTVWYLLYAIVPSALAIPLALATLGPRLRCAAPVLLIGIVAVFAAATRGPTQRLRTHARQPMRETVAWIQTHALGALTANFGVSDRQTLSYDPRVRILATKEDLASAARAAAGEGRPLAVYFCGAAESGKRRPEIMEALRNGLPGEPGKPGAKFAKVADFRGTEAMFSYQVWRMEK